MENLIEKLDKMPDNKNPFNSWSLDEIKQLLDIYFIISKKETHIFKLIYSYHGCDSWEDIFRNYNIQYLNDKVDGVEIAINEVNQQIDRENQK
uniref:Uncharacterized protein n=1 Tax=viral metagenome TaxID=1070528 RepID=A0A6C0IWK8_9ZZZZ